MISYITPRHWLVLRTITNRIWVVQLHPHFISCKGDTVIKTGLFLSYQCFICSILSMLDLLNADAEVCKALFATSGPNSYVISISEHWNWRLWVGMCLRFLHTFAELGMRLTFDYWQLTMSVEPQTDLYMSFTKPNLRLWFSNLFFIVAIIWRARAWAAPWLIVRRLLQAKSSQLQIPNWLCKLLYCDWGSNNRLLPQLLWEDCIMLRHSPLCALQGSACSHTSDPSFVQS